MKQVNVSWNLIIHWDFCQINIFFFPFFNRWFRPLVPETRIYRLLDNSSPSNHQRKTWKTRTSPSGTLEVSVPVLWQHRLFCDMINHKWDTAEWFLTIQPADVSHAIAVYAASSSKLWELAAFTLGVLYLTNDYSWAMWMMMKRRLRSIKFP